MTIKTVIHYDADSVCHCSTTSNMDFDDEDGDHVADDNVQLGSVETTSDTESTGTATPNSTPQEPVCKPKVIRKKQAPVSERELMNAILTTSDLDELDTFGKSVASTLRRLSPHQKAVAKVKIQQVLLDVEFGDVAIPHPVPTSEGPAAAFSTIDSSLLETVMLSCGLPVVHSDATASTSDV